MQVTIRMRGTDFLEKTPLRSLHPAILVSDGNPMWLFAADLAKRADPMHNPARQKLCLKYATAEPAAVVERARQYFDEPPGLSRRG